MCGICGTVGVADAQALARMCEAMRHRGPDDDGRYQDASAGLGMVRLSIIDRAGGRQPMTDERGRYQLVFNGEIYNYRELRAQLEQRGHRLATSSDTEVIVHLYEERQARCLDDLNGDFAIAIWDRHDQRLFLARDRLGVKPLYYWQQGRRLAFASELKALVRLPEVSRDLDPDALQAYFTWLYVPAPASIFRDVRKLPAGCWATFGREGLRIERYWPLPEPAEPAGVSATPTPKELLDRLDEAVRMRLMSEVPLGAFLSGGIDSTAVVGLMSRESARPVQTFSLGFLPPDDSYNELPYARIAAAAYRTDHHELIVKPDVARVLPEVAWHMDEPFADSSSLLTFLICREAKRHVTVALTGIGGDELFGGYPRYLGAWLSGAYARLPRLVRRGLAGLAQRWPESVHSRNLGGWARRFARGGLEAPARRYVGWMSWMPSTEGGLLTGDVQRALTESDPLADACALLEGPGDYLDRVNRFDVAQYLPDDLLVMADKMSLAHGLELRVPFCDHRLAELALSIPLRQRMAGLRLKGLLKQALRDLVPPELLCRRKQGFMLPLGAWLRRALAPLCRELHSPARMRRRGLVRPEAVTSIVDAHLRGAATLTHQVYALLMLELWCERYLDGHSA